jgi:hypothetical protein
VEFPVQPLISQFNGSRVMVSPMQKIVGTQEPDNLIDFVLIKPQLLSKVIGKPKEDGPRRGRSFAVCLIHSHLSVFSRY